jgi:hypothetical protein
MLWYLARDLGDAVDLTVSAGRACAYEFIQEFMQYHGDD